MRTLTRHILIELTVVFTFALTVLTVGVMIWIVLKDLLNHGLPLLQIGLLIPYALPDAMRFSIPGTLLLATTTVYSRMSGYNEIVALKALGISPVTILWPVWVVAFLLSLLTVWLNDVAVSWGRLGAERVIQGAIEDIAYGMLRTERRYESPHFTINVKRVEERTLVRPTVTINARGSTPGIMIEAEEASLQADLHENVLAIMLRNCNMEIEGRGRAFFPEYKLEIPLNDASWGGQAALNPSCLPLWRFSEEIAKQKQAIERRKEELAAAAAQQLLAGEFDRLTGAEWDRRAAETANMEKTLCRLRLEPFRRWSAGFSCLCFVWVGAPMAVWRRNRDFLTSFFLCFLPILIVYYPLLAYGIDGAKNGTIPPVAVWTGNILLLLWGTWLLRKVMRY
jgi:lipopolysaccharide export system permease protein